MIKLPLISDNENVLSAVRNWVNYLAQEQYVKAMELLFQTEDYRYWTPTLVEELISSYNPPEFKDATSVSRVTLIDSTKVFDIKPSYEVKWYEFENRKNGDIVGYVHFDLPINGIWSDLTALFNVRKDVDFLTLELEDIHVL
jgi:hypothetical protein